MTADIKPNRGFTGWHMLAIMCAFFGVIIAVNMVMAYSAVTSWSGLVVANSYVASQEFNQKSITGKEQAALGWQGTFDYRNGAFTYTLHDKYGDAVPTTGATAQFKRPVGDAHDTAVTLSLIEPGKLGASVDLLDGAWIAEVNANAGLDDPYRQITRFIVMNGVYK